MAGDTVITIIGNLTADPEMRFTPSGNAVASFTITPTPRSFDRRRRGVECRRTVRSPPARARTARWWRCRSMRSAPPCATPRPSWPASPEAARAATTPPPAAPGRPVGHGRLHLLRRRAALLILPGEAESLPFPTTIHLVERLSAQTKE